MADRDDRPHRVGAIAASAILLVDVDVAYDSPAARILSRRHPYGLALLDDKMQARDSVGLYGHLKRVHADTVGALVTAFAAGATVHAASSRHPAGPFQAGGLGRLIPLIEEGAGAPCSTGTEALPCAPAHFRAFSFSAKRGGAMPVLNPVSAGPATSGPRELVDAAPVWPAASLRALAEAGPLA